MAVRPRESPGRRALLGGGPVIRIRRSELPSVTVRTCVHCGVHAAFVLDVEGWYACSECGRYA